MKPFAAPALGAILLAALSSIASAQHPLTIDDIAHLAEVGSPEISPDGSWVAYTVTTVDGAKDKNLTTVWMASWDGSKQIQLTQGPASASSPKWSPDGRYLALMRSGPGEDDGEQVWLMDRRGGEARQLTNIRGELSGFAWSPDSKRLALVLREEEPEDRKGGENGSDDDEKRPRPIVIDRYQFKSDENGYHHGKEQPRIFLYDIATSALAALTGVKTFSEGLPAWSPDGSLIAFVSNRDEEWDRTSNLDVWVAEARAGATPRRLTTFNGADEGPLSWSPDGKLIAYKQGSEPKYWLYNYYQAAVVSVNGGAPGLPSTALDRDIDDPQFSADGRSLEFLVTDDRVRYLASVPLDGGPVRRANSDKRVIHAHSRTTRSPQRVAVLSSTSAAPAEIHAFENGKLRAITHHNDAWVAGLRLGAVEGIEYRAEDGMEVHGLVTKPPGWEAGRRYPTLLWIHGGPYGQDEYAFDPEAQLLAANGYVVLQVNYRGSAGRGTAFGRGIFADWGNKDLTDLLTGVDQLVARGIADPQRLGVGGWSQGGILTDYCIAHDTRFKAAISGAGVANQLGIYGIDQYVYMYDLEFGQPWKETERWLKLSAPFFKADRIKTPTLFLGGDKDFNVPIGGGEQMYQALQSQKVPTQLVIYPGEHHGISRPSFVRDRYERYLAWYARYLGGDARSD